MGISSCLRGYFIARRKITPNAVSQLFEQAVRIILIVVLVGNFCTKGLGACAAAVILGDSAAEIFSFLMLWLIWLRDTRKLDNLTGRNRPPFGIVRRILHISVPITSGRYLNTALRTGENILVPKNLAKYPFGGENALSQFGMIKGMALPILFFPSTLLNAVSTLLIPEISEAEARNRHGLVRSATRNILKLTSVIAFIFGAIFFVGGRKIGLLIYKSPEVGELLRALSPIDAAYVFGQHFRRHFKGSRHAKPSHPHRRFRFGAANYSYPYIIADFRAQGIYLDNVFFKRFNLLFKRRQTAARNKG